MRSVCGRQCWLPFIILCPSCFVSCFLLKSAVIFTYFCACVSGQAECVPQQMGVSKCATQSTWHSLCVEVREQLSATPFSLFITWIWGSNSGHLPWHQVPFPAILLYPTPILWVAWRMTAYPVSQRGLLISPSGVLGLQICFNLCDLHGLNSVFSAWKTSTLLVHLPQPYFSMSFNLKCRRKPRCSFSFNSFIFFYWRKCVLFTLKQKSKWIFYVRALKELLEVVWP